MKIDEMTPVDCTKSFRETGSNRRHTPAQPTDTKTNKHHDRNNNCRDSI